jgi:uncharacterized coiled-coil DUF342 family protein
MSNSIIIVGLTTAQWDIITSVLDGAHELTESQIKSPEAIDMTPTQINDLKEYANDLVEILDEIADQISGITEEITG